MEEMSNQKLHVAPWQALTPMGWAGSSVAECCSFTGRLGVAFQRSTFRLWHCWASGLQFAQGHAPCALRMPGVVTTSTPTATAASE